MMGMDSLQGGLKGLEATNQPTTVDQAAAEAMAASKRPWQMLGEQAQGASSLLGIAQQFASSSAGSAVSAAAGLGKV